MNTKHKLSGYCIRGGEQIAERIRKVFEEDGVIVRRWSNKELSNDVVTWYCDKDDSELYCHNRDNLTEITISEAEAIVYGTESEKTFPREMLVSDDEKTWEKRMIFGYCETLGLPWLSHHAYDYFTGYRYARELPETIPYNTAKEIISKATDKGVNDFEIETKKE